jgi:mono/diheme cytochrome c family protein
LSRYIRTVSVAITLAVVTINAAGTELSRSEIGAAKRLYNAKCAKCHKFYDPAAYEPAEWERWMQAMGRKSKLKPEQYDLLSRYLETFRTHTKGETLKR